MTMASGTTVELLATCRCCLQERNDLIYIFREVSEKIPRSYAAVVKECVGLEITSGDGLPNQICSGCTEEAERSYNFKKMCLNSDQQLRPSTEAELKLCSEASCQTDEAIISSSLKKQKDKGCYDLEAIQLTEEHNSSKDGIQKNYEGLSVSLDVEIKDGGLTDIVHEQKQSLNTSDIPLSEESMLSVLDIEKSKVSDVMEEHELGEVISSLNSPVSDGDFSSWLVDNQEEKRDNRELAEQSRSMCEERKGSGEDSCPDAMSIFEDKTPGGGESKNKPDGNSASVESETNMEDDLDKKIVDQMMKLDEYVEGDIEGEGKNSDSVDAEADKKSRVSVEGKLTIKPLEDLTYEGKSIMVSTTTAEVQNDVAPKASRISEDAKNELTLDHLLKGSDVKGVIPVGPSCNNADFIPSLRDKTLGQIIIHSLNKGECVNQDQLTMQSFERELLNRIDPGKENASLPENITGGSRKRSRGDNDKQQDTEEVHIKPAGPLSKKTCTGERSVEDISSKEVNDNVEISSSETVTPTVDPHGDRTKANEGEMKEANPKCVSSETKKDENELEQTDEHELEGLSDEDLLGDDDSVSNSSGSEYLPVDSPAMSDDSLRPRKSSTKPRARDKSQPNKLKVQGFNIRECRVVLSDIARPSSSALTNSNSMSSHVSVSSLKSVENDQVNEKENKEEKQKETEDVSDNTSSCTAWIKVEPEDMEGVEGQSTEENMLHSEQAEGGAWNAASSNVNAEQEEGASGENQTIFTKVVGGRRRFLCPFCAKSFRSRNQMMLHRGVHTGDLPYPCEVCGKRFALRCRLLRHMSVHDSAIVCEFCGMDFKNNIMLGRHIKAKHTIPSYAYSQSRDASVPHLVKPSENTAQPPQPPPSKAIQRFPCRLCPRVFSSINGLKGHKRVHMSHSISASLASEASRLTEQKTGEKTCKICGMAFPNPLYLKSHMVCHTIIRPNSGRVNSIESPRGSHNVEESSRLGVASHKMQEESINVMEPTVLIHESPTTYGEGSSQLQNQSSLVWQHVCAVCSQIFTSHSQLLRHQSLTGHQPRPVKCDACLAMFASAEQLQSHMLSQHSSPINFIKREHKCNICGKIFSKSSRLNQHMNYHLIAADPIICQMCGKYFASLEQLNIHRKTHESPPVCGTGMNVSNDLCCSVCRRVFSKRSRLKRHMILHESQSFPCSKCSKTFISEELLAEHQLHHNQTAASSPSVTQSPAVTQSPGESEDGILCTACGRTFTNRGRLKQHVVVHTKSGFVACQNCFKVFSNSQMLEMHAVVCASAEEASDGSQSNVSNKSASLPHPSGFASCTSCGKAFPSKELLIEHEKTCVGRTVMKKLDGTWKVLDSDDRPRVASTSSTSSNSSINSSSKHNQSASNEGNSESKVYPCKICGKRFSNYHGLNSHMRFHQDNTGTSKCELCSKLFPSRNKLSQHMSSHSAVYRCGICSQAFGLVEELKKHVGQCMATQTGAVPPNYIHCTGCTEVFSLLEELAEHIKCHAEEFPHACSECYKVFAHPTQLTRHINTNHNKGDPSKNACIVCQKVFSSRASLEKHMVVHTGEKKFECPYCMQRFSQKSSLHRHQLTQHETKS